MPDTIFNPEIREQLAGQIAEAALTKFALLHPELNHVQAEIPPPLKWAAGIIGALFPAGIAAVAFWVVSSINTMQVTLARMDERQEQASANQGTWKADIEGRLTRLEAHNALQREEKNAAN